MIPKIIHYCWFGKTPLPKKAVKCLNSWKKYFPDYEIKEWNESNFDVDCIPYTKQAYAAKKYAFVSDYARFQILYQHGGVYFDTDVEVIQSMTDILATGAFMGCEVDGTPVHAIEVAPGLGLAVAPGHAIYQELIQTYADLTFCNADGTLNTKTVVKYTTELLLLHGLENMTGTQQIEGITIYPKEFFNPLDDSTGVLHKTKNTYAIHWYAKSWIPTHKIVRSKVTRVFHRLFGVHCFDWLKRKKP